MELSPGNWFPVISTRELGAKPLAKTRFGQKLVFWRDANGKAVCMPDRCPHRGAELSLGRVKGDVIACPFHGFEYDASGRCTRIPPEGDRPIPTDFGLKTFPVCESDEYVWLWRGSATSVDHRPPPPQHPDLTDLSFGEATSIWPAHYTRCIENVCDYSHLPFVHRTTIGLFKGETQTNIEMEDIGQGFRAYLMEEGKPKQCLEFLYPNLWMLKISQGFMMSAVFTPIDERRTEVYGRTYYKTQLPGIRPLMDVYTRFSQFLVFREDWPIVSGQDPADVADISEEILLPSDAPVMAYRKLHKAHRDYQQI
jgi:phenylpropionate dioxygenase-like ring-hydroxylating dioxygenase large terminal subunit